MLDEEFFKIYPVSVFHGVEVLENDVQALFTNPRVRPYMYGVGEDQLFRGISRSREHQRICPQDTRDAAELAVNTEALKAVQAKKLELGIELMAPLLDSPPRLRVISGGLDPKP